MYGSRHALDTTSDSESILFKTDGSPYYILVETNSVQEESAPSSETENSETSHSGGGTGAGNGPGSGNGPSTGGTSDTAKTGDETNLPLWFGVLTCSAAVIMGCFLYHTRDKESKEKVK